MHKRAELTLAPEFFVPAAQVVPQALPTAPTVFVLSVSPRESCLSVKNDDASADKNSDCDEWASFHWIKCASPHLVLMRHLQTPPLGFVSKRDSRQE